MNHHHDTPGERSDDTPGERSESEPKVRVRVIESVAIPVHTCHVLIRREAGRYHARVANLDGLAVEAASEREALQRVVESFKERLQNCQAAGETLTLRDPPFAVEPGESPRLIAVHL